MISIVSVCILEGSEVLNLCRSADVATNNRVEFSRTSEQFGVEVDVYQSYDHRAPHCSRTVNESETFWVTGLVWTIDIKADRRSSKDNPIDSRSLYEESNTEV